MLHLYDIMRILKKGQIIKRGHEYLFFSGLGTLFFFVSILLLFGSSLFFFVLFVILFLLSFLGGRLLCSIVLKNKKTTYRTLNKTTEGYTSKRGQGLI